MSSPKVEEGPAPHSQTFGGVAFCLGVLCVLLVSTILPLCVYFSTALSEHNTNLVRELEQLTDEHISLLAANQDLMNLYCKLSVANHILQSDYIKVSTENQQLKAERMNLSRERDGLNWTLGVIFQLKNFPVDNYCPYEDANTKVPFGHLWRTWQGSRQHCKNNNADLVDIGSQEEQEFILNNTQAYYDEDHGYWIGLTDIAEDGQWLWVDGRNQNLTDGQTSNQNESPQCSPPSSTGDVKISPVFLVSTGRTRFPPESISVIYCHQSKQGFWCIKKYK
ncbi:C-type lectin domain family 4 member F-like isoform X3 [Oncorhynchus keta]|uniref:C-type lectin domain family 4 member F-like isoform X3 n=1 Tax=Oncorhynchus keta TaxID=8018 RepID=UPI0015F81D28|nr:C-type lectin domain family 4 member F-like isoform X3 [Oncorhynchus keta]